MRSRICARVFPLVLPLLLPVAATANAQVRVEIGAQAGLASVTFSGTWDRPLVGIHVGVWFDDRVELRARVVRATMPDYDSVYWDGVMTINTQDRSRTLFLGEVIYAFRPTARVRPLLGLSTGLRRDASTVTCSPGECPLTLGPPTTTHPTLGFIAGFIGRVTERLAVEVSVGFHDPPGEGAATSAATVSFVYALRNGRRSRR